MALRHACAVMAIVVAQTVCGLAAASARGLPANAPLPPPRPDAAAPEPLPGEAEVPLPPPRPETTPSEPVRAESQRPAAGESPDDAACLTDLDRLGVAYERRPPVGQEPCGAPRPLLVTRLPDGVDVSPAALMTCPTARALARWALEVVSAEADSALGARLSAVQIGTAYECRGQNRQAGAKLSEHAFAAAVDVMGFTLGPGRTAPVANAAPGSPEAAFLAAVRAGACRHFTTVLGPGSDAAHADHLHLDLRARRGGHRICQ